MRHRRKNLAIGAEKPDTSPGTVHLLEPREEAQEGLVVRWDREATVEAAKNAINAAKLVTLQEIVPKAEGTEAALEAAAEDTAEDMAVVVVAAEVDRPATPAEDMGTCLATVPKGRNVTTVSLVART